jgi:hypothetical protein
MLRRLCTLAPLLLLAACAADAGEIPDGADEGGERGPGGRPGETDPGSPTDPGTGGPGATSCVPSPVCTGTGGPLLPPTRAWNHPIASRLVVASGAAYHRGRDQIVAVGETQWIIGKFTYGLLDTDLDDEDVDVWVERGCGGQWEKLGTTKTTTAGAHPTTEGVEDSGGRVYFKVPDGKTLAPGRHRVRLVVAGDNTSADLLVDVVPKSAPVFVSDVDGTLTESENAEYGDLLARSLPQAQPRAADVLTELAKKGYRPVYVTARPEWLTKRTREFLASRGFPTGTIHTTTGITGALGGAAASFKANELALLKQKGFVIGWAFGNKTSDGAAYEAAKIDPKDHRIFLRVTDDNGGRRIEAYSELVADVQKIPAVCK